MEDKCYLSQVVLLMQTHLIAGDKGRSPPPGMSGGWRWGSGPSQGEFMSPLGREIYALHLGRMVRGESGSRELFLCLLLPNYLQLQIVFMPK